MGLQPRERANGRREPQDKKASHEARGEPSSKRVAKSRGSTKNNERAGGIRPRTAHRAGFGEADHKGFCGAAVSTVDAARPMTASWRAVVNLLEPDSPEKQKPAEGRALHPVETGEFQSLAGLRFPDIASGSQAVIFR